MTEQPDTTVVFRSRGDSRLCAVVRTVDGVFDVQHREGRWWCGCGSPGGCLHVLPVELALARAKAPATR
jgi:hypothetical protein